MSAVRMCDRCGNMFSERSDGWTSSQVSRIGRNKEGRPTTIVENLDACAECSNGLEIPDPRLPHAERSTREAALRQARTEVIAATRAALTDDGYSNEYDTVTP